MLAVIGDQTHGRSCIVPATRRTTKVLLTAWLLFVDSTPLNSSESGIGRFSRELRLVFRPADHQGSTSGEKKQVIIMFKTVGDLIKALQKFPITAQVQADNKAIQSVSSTASASAPVVQISTIAPA